MNHPYTRADEPRPVVQGAAADTDEEFLARIKRMGENWRLSDEFIGIVVRARYPRNYDYP
jgi:hypothetical protein